MLVFFILFLCGNNLLLYWVVFLIAGVLICFIISFEGFPVLTILNYFFFQELLGIFFILNLLPYMQILILFVKVGLPPFYFWVFYLVRFTSGFFLVWFLLWSKIIYLPVFVIFLEDFIFIILFGLFLIYIHIFCISSFVNVVVLGSMERFSWALLIINISLLTFWVVIFVYIITGLFLFNSSSEAVVTDMLFGFLLLGLPFNIVFILKFLGIFTGGFILLAVLCFMCLSLISLIFIIFESVLRQSFFEDSVFIFLPFLFGLFLIFLI